MYVFLLSMGGLHQKYGDLPAQVGLNFMGANQVW